MRQTNIGNAYIEYPEELIWKQDSTAVKLYGVSNIGASIVVANPLQEYYVLEYYSDQNELLFYLDDAIKALWSDNIGAWYCKIGAFQNGTSLGTAFNFNFHVLDGKSFTSRSHGISSTIYVYGDDELDKVQVFSPQQGIASIGQSTFNCYYGLNQYNLSTIITDDGEYQLCLRDSSQVPSSVSISGVDVLTPTSGIISFSVIGAGLINETHGGDVFAENKLIYPICHRIIYQSHCEDYNFGEIKYTNLDGMTRYLGGKVITDTDDVKTESYYTSSTDIYNRNPNRYIISHNKTIKLYISDIEKDAYPHDLLYSNDIYFKTWDGEWKQCSLNTNKFERKDEDYYDIELEIVISE